MQYKIIDDFLCQENFLEIRNTVVGNQFFPWFVCNNVSGNDGDADIYFVHLFYKDFTVNSNEYRPLVPLIDGIKPLSLIRIKANFYPKTETIHYHQYHIDRPEPHQGAIYYLNTNNGKTILDDETEIESIENRLLLFEPHIKHRSTTCTDNYFGRYNINFNFIKHDCF